MQSFSSIHSSKQTNLDDGEDNDRIFLDSHTVRKSALRALPLWLAGKPNDALSTAALPPECTDNISFNESVRIFVERNGLRPKRFRCVASNGFAVCRASVANNIVGHPFIDALLFAHRHQLSFSFGPLCVWDLISDAVVLHFHENSSVYNSLMRQRRGLSGSPDGVFRMCMDTQTAAGDEDGPFDPLGAKLWPAVREHLLSTMRKTSLGVDYLSTAATHENDDSDADDNGAPLNPVTNEFVLNTNGRDTGMPPLNLLVDRIALPTPSRTSHPTGPGSKSSSLRSIHFRGTLSEWTSLFNAIGKLSAFPPLRSWTSRVLWIVYHIIEYYYRFTPSTQTRPSIDDSALCLMRSGGDAVTDIEEIFKKFFIVHPANGPDPLRIGGFVTLLFPIESGRLQLTPNMVNVEQTRSLINARLLVFGLDAGLFTNRLLSFSSLLATPTQQVSVRHITGPIGFVVHEKQRVVSLVGGSFALMQHPTNISRTPSLKWFVEKRAWKSSDEWFENIYVDRFEDERAKTMRARTEIVSNLVRLLDTCQGNVDFAEKKVGESRSVREWPRDDDLCALLKKTSGPAEDLDAEKDTATVTKSANKQKKKKKNNKKNRKKIKQMHQGLRVTAHESAAAGTVKNENNFQASHESDVQKSALENDVATQEDVPDMNAAEKGDVHDCAASTIGDAPISVQEDVLDTNAAEKGDVHDCAESTIGYACVKHNDDEKDASHNCATLTVVEKQVLVPVPKPIVYGMSAAADARFHVGMPRGPHEQVPVRILYRQGTLLRSEADAVRHFVMWCVHPTFVRGFGVLHCCSKHRDWNIAPEQPKNFATQTLSLHHLLVALADYKMHCHTCGRNRQPPSPFKRLPTRHHPLLLQGDAPLAPIPQFVSALYSALATVAGGSAFRACSVCKREFSNDLFDISLLVLGVDRNGAARFRLAFCCVADGSPHDCAAQEMLDHSVHSSNNGKDNPSQGSFVGLSCSAISYPALNGDTVVRVHARGTESTSCDDDLLLHLPTLPFRKVQFVSKVPVKNVFVHKEC